MLPNLFCCFSQHKYPQILKNSFLVLSKSQISMLSIKNIECSQAISNFSNQNLLTKSPPSISIYQNYSSLKTLINNFQKRTYKIKTCIKKICDQCQIVRRKRTSYVICKAHAKHKQKQFIKALRMRDRG